MEVSTSSSMVVVSGISGSEVVVVEGLVGFEGLDGLGRWCGGRCGRWFGLLCSSELEPLESLSSLCTDKKIGLFGRFPFIANILSEKCNPSISSTSPNFSLGNNCLNSSSCSSGTCTSQFTKAERTMENTIMEIIAVFILIGLKSNVELTDWILIVKAFIEETFLIGIR